MGLLIYPLLAVGPRVENGRTRNPPTGADQRLDHQGHPLTRLAEVQARERSVRVGLPVVCEPGSW